MQPTSQIHILTRTRQLCFIDDYCQTLLGILLSGSLMGRVAMVCAAMLSESEFAKVTAAT